MTDDLTQLQLRELFLQTGDDADLPIVDAHHHFFDVDANYHPWLRDRPLLPFRYGDYSSICKNFLPADYRKSAAGHRIVQSVLIEGEWNPADPLGEVNWVEKIAAASGLPSAMAGQAWLDRDDIDEVLAGHARSPLVRSVRHKPRALPRQDYRNDYSAPGSMRCPRWLDGYAKLARHDLMFELQVFWWHFAEAAELAHAFPHTTIIVNHTGLPSDRSEEGLAAWRAALVLLAREDNVHLKISGICVPGRRWSAQLNGAVVRDAIAIFGVERCSFASNFPVDSLHASMDEIYAGFKEICAHMEPSDRLKLFHDNAIRIYRL
ncbi:MAG: amidohydrolase family protein [Pseudomonadota bacterium]